MQGRQAKKTDAVRQKPPIPRDLLRRWLDRDGAPEQPWLNQRLIFAARDGIERITFHFLKKGADVNAKDDVGRTALMEAAWRNHPELCEILIERSAEVNAADNTGNTALMYAARGGNTKACLLLIENGADMDAKDKTFNRTPLMWARELFKMKTAAFLRYAGVLAKVIGKDGFRQFLSDFSECTGQ